MTARRTETGRRVAQTIWQAGRRRLAERAAAQADRRAALAVGSADHGAPFRVYPDDLVEPATARQISVPSDVAPAKQFKVQR
jgi:hypothetical protein